MDIYGRTGGSALRWPRFLMAIACSPLLIAQDSIGNEAIKWAWTCRSYAFDQLKISPNGEPALVHDGEQKRIIFNVRAISDWARYNCPYYGSYYYYYLQIEGDSDLAKLFNSWSYGKIECAHAQFDTRNDEIESMMSNSPDRTMSAIIERDDSDWRFALSGTDLTTERHGRRLRIEVPQPGIGYEAKTSAYILHGDCVMSTGTPHVDFLLH